MRTVIVGAVALGATCGARLKRLDPKHEVILLDKGRNASFAHCGLPYYIGNEVEHSENLLIAKKSVFLNRFNIDLRLNSEVVKIDPANKTVTVFDHIKDEKYKLEYDNLVLAMGATAVKPKFPGIVDKDIFYFKTIEDAIELKDKVANFKRVAVVGGGFIGIEAMESLVANNIQVELIEELPHVTNVDYDMACIAHKIIKDHGVNLHVNTKVLQVKRTTEGLVIKTTNGDITVDGIVMAVGVKPCTKIAVEAGIELEEDGTIKVDDHLRTNYPNIYAGGDLVSNYDSICNHLVYAPFATFATKHARIIANNIKGYNYKRPKITLASVLKLFDYTIASVGLNEEYCKKYNIESQCLYQCANSHAKYYPNLDTIYAKIRFDNSGRILGAIMIGKENVEKRIDELSALLQKKCTYQDLMDVESSYAPPYNTPKDILNYFGYMIDNELNYNIHSITPLEAKQLPKDSFILDVRSNNSYNKGHLENSINIPIDLLRSKMKDLPLGKPIYVYCNTGIKAYNASCILKRYGYNVINISGGYRLFDLIN